jgi:2-C-methyl-D-erythritol 4-phosphate cytidylyltransferase
MRKTKSENRPRVAAVIPAAGSGKRMLVGKNKIWLSIGGETILAHTLKIFLSSVWVDRIVLVVNEVEVKDFERFLKQLSGNSSHPVDLVIGGAERQDSVANGLRFLVRQEGWGQNNHDLAVIHDAARALVTEAVLVSAIKAAIECRAIGVGVPVKDTIKQIDPNGYVLNTPERSSLWAVQTPQVFQLRLLFECYQRVTAQSLSCTDDCGVVEACGYPVKMIMGSYENIKITTPEDLSLVETILRRRDGAANRSRY